MQFRKTRSCHILWAKTNVTSNRKRTQCDVFLFINHVINMKTKLQLNSILVKMDRIQRKFATIFYTSNCHYCVLFSDTADSITRMTPLNEACHWVSLCNALLWAVFWPTLYRVAQKSKLLYCVNSLLFWATLYIITRNYYNVCD